MKKTVGLLCLATISLASVALAQEAYKETRTVASAAEARPALDIFSADASYVFESKLHDHGVNFGDQDAFSGSLEYSHRFFLAGKIYLRAGFSYQRFEFGNTFAPVPDHLQSIAGLVKLEYLVGNDVGAFLEFRPGFYTEDHIGISSFDVPITGGRVFVLQPEKLFLFVGANVAFLRGEYPILPVAGLVWRPNKQWTVNAIVPEPRLIYSPNDRLSFWLGGQLTGGSYRTDRDNTIFPVKLRNAAVDYSEYRAGVGIEFHPTNAVSLNVGGGYVFTRRFNFERADEEFKADGAPYLRAALHAEF